MDYSGLDSIVFTVYAVRESCLLCDPWLIAGVFICFCMKRKRDFGDVKSIFADLKRRIDFDKVAEEEAVLSPELEMSRLKDSSKEISYSLDEIGNIIAFFW